MIQWIAGGLLIGVAFSIAGLFAAVAAHRSLTQLEGVLLQAFSLIAGLAGSFLFGRQSARTSAREMLKPHARSAFRRLMSLYWSLSRLAAAIESERQVGDPNSGSGRALDRLQAIVMEEIETADDAMADWADIIPDDVEELRQRIRGSRSREDRHGH